MVEARRPPLPTPSKASGQQRTAAHQQSAGEPDNRIGDFFELTAERRAH
jgi:hypothetical protein